MAWTSGNHNMIRITTYIQGSICRKDGGTCPGQWISRYGSERPILCWYATAAQKCPPHWLYPQIPPCLYLWFLL